MPFNITINKTRHSAQWQIVMLIAVMLSDIYAECLKIGLYDECQYAECHYAECSYAECRGAFSTNGQYYKTFLGYLL
jgi:hypothetical protein